MSSFADRYGFIWFDGALKPWRECTTHVLTYTLHYGVGCFEGVRAYQTPKGTAIFRLNDHTQRLFSSAKILGMKMPFTPEQLNEAQLEVLRRNNLKEAYLRPMVFYGAEGMGLRADNLKTHVIVAAWTWGAAICMVLVAMTRKSAPARSRRCDLDDKVRCSGDPLIRKQFGRAFVGHVEQIGLDDIDES